MMRGSWAGLTRLIVAKDLNFRVYLTVHLVHAYSSLATMDY